MTGSFFAALAAIIWIDLLLSGDNAVVIALVCKGLPERQQRLGMVLGAAAAICLRIGGALAISILISVEGLRIAGGILVLWIAFKLLKDESDDEQGQGAPKSLIGAITAIAVADASMSLDNVLAVAALAKGNVVLMTLGIVLSIPIVIAGAAVIKAAADRFPWLVWLGAGILAWVGGSIILEDPLLSGLQIPHFTVEASPVSIASAALVILAGLIYRSRGVASPFRSDAQR